MGFRRPHPYIEAWLAEFRRRAPFGRPGDLNALLEQVRDLKEVAHQLQNELAGHRLAVRMQWVGIAILLGLLVL